MNVHYERTGGMEAQKYLRKGCCHHIKCFATNFLAALMWRRPLNNAALATPTHRGPERGCLMDKHSSSGSDDQQV